MKKIKLNKLVLNKIFKGLVDTMIPMSQDKIMPKASEAINLKLFLKNILIEKKLKNLIYEKIYIISKNNIKKKTADWHDLGVKIAKSKIIEKDIEKYLLESYFTSKRVQKQLLKKTDKTLYVKKNKNKKIFLLLKLVKKADLRYKNV